MELDWRHKKLSPTIWLQLYCSAVRSGKKSKPQKFKLKALFGFFFSVHPSLILPYTHSTYTTHTHTFQCWACQFLSQYLTKTAGKEESQWPWTQYAINFFICQSQSEHEQIYMFKRSCCIYKCEILQKSKSCICQGRITETEKDKNKSYLIQSLRQFCSIW